MQYLKYVHIINAHICLSLSAEYQVGSPCKYTPGFDFAKWVTTFHVREILMGMKASIQLTFVDSTLILK